MANITSEIITKDTGSLGDAVSNTIDTTVDSLLNDVEIPENLKGVADGVGDIVADGVGDIIDDIINPSSDSDDGLSPFVICLLSTLGIGAAATATIFGINTNGFSTTPTCCQCSSIDDFPFCDFTKIVPE